MSDGNFNRSLLPHTPFESALRQGKAMARERALAAFREMLPAIVPSLSDEEREAFVEEFRLRLLR